MGQGDFYWEKQNYTDNKSRRAYAFLMATGDDWDLRNVYISSSEDCRSDKQPKSPTVSLQ